MSSYPSEKRGAITKAQHLLTAAQLTILIVVALAIAAATIPMLKSRGLQSEAAYPIQTAEEILTTGAWPRTAFYPPMVTILALAVRFTGEAWSPTAKRVYRFRFGGPLGRPPADLAGEDVGFDPDSAAARDGADHP